MTPTQINELKAERMNLIAEARKINDGLIGEDKKVRAMTGEEETKYENLMTEADTRQKTIAREEKIAGLTETNTRAIPPETPDRDEEATFESRTRAERIREKRSSKEYRAAFDKFLRRGQQALTNQERRDLSVDSDVDGGYLVSPIQMVEGILKDLDDQVHIRSKARKFNLVNAKSLGVVRRTAKMNTAAWGGEITPPTKDDSLKFGKRELTPNFMTLLSLASRDLLANSSDPAEAIVSEELAINAAELEEQALITGDGQGKPLGVMTASADGISTARDVSTDNTSTAITADGLMEAKFSLKAPHRRTAEWMFHRDAVKMIAKLQDANDHYLWEPSLKAGEPDRILGLPYEESEWMPNTFTTGLYVGILANWNKYWIVDALDWEMQRLKELYSLSNQDGFLARRKVDGQPVLEEAFARVTLG